MYTIYVCLHSYILCMHIDSGCVCTDTYMCAYIHTYTGIHMYTYIHAYIHRELCLPYSCRQMFMFVYKHACIHAYILHTFLPRHIHNFRVKYFQNFQICIFSIFPDNQNLILWKYRNSANMLISTSVTDNYLLIKVYFILV